MSVHDCNFRATELLLKQMLLFCICVKLKRVLHAVRFEVAVADIVPEQ